MKFIKFAVACKIMHIPFYTGLALFTNNIYIHQHLRNSVPFIGHNLDKNPWLFKSKAIPPENLFCSVYALNEMQRRFRSLPKELKDKFYIKKDEEIKQHPINKRERLSHLRDGCAYSFRGTIDRIGNITNTCIKNSFHVCITDVYKCGSSSDLIKTDEPITDHIWIAIPNRFKELVEKHAGDEITFMGRVGTYKQIDDISKCEYRKYNIYIQKILWLGDEYIFQDTIYKKPKVKLVMDFDGEFHKEYY